MGKTIHYKNFDEVKEKINNLWDSKFTFLDENFEYKNVHQHVKIQCNDCLEIYEKRINDLLHGHGCRGCTGRKFRDNIEMKKYVEEITSKEYSLISDNFKTRDIALFKHNSEMCRNENSEKTFNMKIHNFITLNQRCPYCNRESKGLILSHGNLAIREYLTKNNISFEPEYSIPECRSKNNTLLSFDIFVPSKKLLIEFDGIQHFEPVEYFGGETVFLQTVENDGIKNTFVKEKTNYTLLRIHYKDFKKITDILNNTFNGHLYDKLYQNRVREYISETESIIIFNDKDMV